MNKQDKNDFQPNILDEIYTPKHGQVFDLHAEIESSSSLILLPVSSTIFRMKNNGQGNLSYVTINF